jgi:hypothetical protein
LKTLEKINRKGIRNSLKIEKLNSAQLAQAGPTPPRARPRPSACPRRLSACFTRALSPLSPSHCPVGQSCRCRFSRAHAPSLPLRGGPFPSVLTARSRIPSRCPVDPACQPLQPSLTSHSRPHRGCAHDRTFSGHVLTTAPL